MAPSDQWKKLKTIITGCNALKKLRSLDPESLKSIRNVHDKNLLHVAAKHASLGICKYLIESGLEVNLKSKITTPLIYALRRHDDESKKIIKFLFNIEADMSWTDLSIGSQSHIIFDDRKRIAEMLCMALKKREGSYEAAASHLLAKGWTFDNIAYLQHNKMSNCALLKDDVLNTNFNKLTGAVSGGDVRTLKLLLNSIAHSERILSWLLSSAVKSRAPEHLIIMKLLLDAGAPIQGFMGDENTPLEEALLTCRADAIWMLLHHGAKIENLKTFETFNRLLRLTFAMANIFDGDFSPEKKESMSDCMRIIIEYKGVVNNVELIQKLSKDLDGLGLLKLQYLSIVHHFSENHYSIMSCFDLFQDSFDSFSQHSLSSQSLFQKFTEECSDELEKLKNKHTVEGISFIHLLVKSIDEISLVPSKEGLMTEIEAQSFVDMFPKYSKNLQFKVKMALEKKLQTERSIDVLSQCVPIIGCCHPALEKIVYYLDDPFALSLYWNDFFKQS